MEGRRDDRVCEHDAVGEADCGAAEAAHHEQAMRRPSPDLTTAWATMNATTTNRTLELAKPEKACAGVMVPVRTTVATAIIEDVSNAKALSRTDAIAATNTANRCHAGAVSRRGQE